LCFRRRHKLGIRDTRHKARGTSCLTRHDTTLNAGRFTPGMLGLDLFLCHLEPIHTRTQ
jgi:hypothetical protein